MRRRSFAILLSSALAASSPALAIDWINPAGGTFQVGSNWSGGVVPGSADTARFALTTPVDVTLTADVSNDRLLVTGGADVTFHTAPVHYIATNSNIAGITVGDVASNDPARFTVATGHAAAFDVMLGEQIGSTGIGTVNLGSDLGASRLLTVGGAGTGTLSMLGAPLNANAITLGDAASGVGFLHMDGGFFGGHPIRVGRFGTGTLLITGGTDIGSGTVIVGDESGSHGLIDLRLNVEWSLGGTLCVGRSGSGTLLLGTGTIANNGATCIAQLPGSHGLIDVNAGSFVIGQSLNVGGDALSPGGDGTLMLRAGSISVGGTLRAWNHGSIDWIDGNMSAGSIDLKGGGTMNVASASAAKVLKTQKVTIDLAQGSRLDLNDNDAILTSTTRSQIESYVIAARSSGDWTGAGLSSSTARDQPQHATGLGVVLGSEYKSINGATATFDGFTVANTDVLVKYTWCGDTDFNGKVDGADYARVDATFNNEASQGDIGGWFNGDFDYNGKIDGADYALIDSAFNAQSGTLGPGATIPEPANMLSLTVALPALRRVRRARR